MENIRIAVIGLGPAGLTALKSLREEGFDAVAFERRDKVGGVWSYSPNTNYTSVVGETVANISKFVSGFSDFPIPKDYPPYLSGTQVAEYFQSYAKHFDLERHIHFNTTVHKVVRDEAEDAWQVHLTGSGGDAVARFDKVVVGTGSQTSPVWPRMPGRDKFQGIVMHGQNYRSPEQFAGKRVLVVGIGNTACEVAISLSGRVAKLYQAYRRGRIMVSRYLDSGIPTDSTIAWPMLRLKYMLDHKAPWLTFAAVDRLMVRKMIRDAARDEPALPGASERERRRRARQRVKSDWRLTPCPSMAHEHPAVQEDFISVLYSGAVEPVRGFKGFVGANHVLLADDSVVEVDAVIFCTGYSHDLRVMPELEMDGACGLPLITAGEARVKDHGDGPKQPHVPRLYQMIFPPRYASSVALLSWMAPQESVWCVCELASMAVAQVWAAETSRELGLKSPPPGYRQPSFLPPLEEMNAQVDEYHAWWRKEWEKEPSVRPGYLQAHTFYRFLHKMAGTAMYDNVDHLFTGRGWKLWRKDRDLYKWIARGPMSSHSWRLFETNPGQIPGCGRSTWHDARWAVQDAFETYQAYKRAVQDKKAHPESESLLTMELESSTLGGKF
ncbi:flavin-binding monooxygenase-like domain-containing protein [Hirsutella rhossiliensis]|uniref:Flavin-binding monooxygenase-like domain-containing protein n=1 Tax=Hirsutella rhossiliensis TaxID=111463 RepID=A0A9P8MX39_9HYPO|nr:flavin-binding monooxygenase-like domain-containing protein [Hirsutella rhossiliensis]KAH0963688.1 flavin-binding monooxygenase-like domain-containing protein [Hirsutella rhossiliensis]